MRLKQFRPLLERLEGRDCPSTLTYEQWTAQDPDYSNYDYWGSGHLGSPWYNEEWQGNVGGGAPSPYNDARYISLGDQLDVVGVNGMYFPGLSSNAGDFVDVNGMAVLENGNYYPTKDGMLGAWRYAWGSNFAQFMPEGATEPPPQGGGGGEEPPPAGGGGGGGGTSQYDAWILSDPDFSNSAYWGSGHTGSVYWDQAWGYAVAGGAVAPNNRPEFISGALMSNVPGQNGMFFPGLESNAGDSVSINGYAELRDGFYLPALSGIEGQWNYMWGSNVATLTPTVAPPPAVLPPDAPHCLVDPPGNRFVTLEWAASANADTYNVYRGLAPGSLTLLATGVTTTSFTDAGLTNGVTYYYAVSACNEGGESGFSNITHGTPFDPSWVWVLSDSSINNVLELAKQAVDTGNAGTLTLADGLVLYGDSYNLVGLKGGAVKGIIYSTTNLSNGSKLTGFDFKATVIVDVLVNGIVTELSFDLYSVR